MSIKDGLDSNQTIVLSYDDSSKAHRVLPVNQLIPEQFDSVQLTYIANGNGTGEIGTASYFSQGDLIAMLVLTYDSSNRLTGVTRA